MNVQRSIFISEISVRYLKFFIVFKNGCIRNPIEGIAMQ
jgi:hypothetical protein